MQRMAWPDVARGICILGVIILHVGLMVPQASTTAIYKFNDNLLPLRMALFFMISGFFAKKAMNMTLGDVLSKRIWFLAIPYLFWVPIELWLKTAEIHVGTGADMHQADFYMDQLVYGKSTYWFLHALVAFTIVLWACRYIPQWARWGLVAFCLVLPWLMQLPVVEAVAPWIPGLLDKEEGVYFLAKYLKYLPIFMMGAFLRPAITKLADNALRPWVLAASIGLLLVGRRLFTWHGDPWSLTVTALASIMHLPIAVVIAVIVSRIPVVSALFQLIGRNTLTIYLGHMVGFTLLFGFTFRYAGFAFDVDAANFIDRPTFWMYYGIAAALAGGVAMFYLQRVPIIGWTIKPPAFADFMVRFSPRFARRRAEQQQVAKVRS